MNSFFLGSVSYCIPQLWQVLTGSGLPRSVCACVCVCVFANEHVACTTSCAGVYVKIA